VGGAGSPVAAEDAVRARSVHTWQAMCDLVRLLVPIVAGSFIGVAADRWSLAFVGHWDYKDISHYDGASIGKMYSNVTGLSLGVAATIGLSTFASQAHGAGCSREQNPIFNRRAVLLLSGCFAFAFTAAVLGQPLLTALGQPPAVALTSARYAQVQLIGVPFWWLTNVCNTSLNSTKRTRPGLVTSIISSFSQLVYCVILMHPQICNMGYLGVALGRVLGGMTSLTIMVLYIKCAKLQDFVWRRQPGAEPVFRDGAFRHYLSVSIPSALVVWSEWWAFEVLALFVGLTPNAAENLAAHGTMFNIIAVAYMCWTGACTALCTLVGNKLGQERNAEIPPLLRAAFIFSLTTSLIVALSYEAFKDVLARAFTEDPRVQALLSSSSIGLVLSVPMYAQLMTFFGALRGANMQKPGILGTVIGYWVVGIPLGGLLGCILHWPTPLIGVWLGNVVALAIAASWVLIAVFVKTDWMAVRKVAGIRTSLLGAGRSAPQELAAAGAGAPRPAAASAEEKREGGQVRAAF